MKRPQQIGACALLFNNNGWVLLGKRKNGYKEGYYGLPGGRVEVNEPVVTTVQREVEEETGLKLDNFEYLGVVRENQGDYDFIHFVYAAKNISKQPMLREPEKCEGWIWTDINNINEDVLPGHQAAIEMYLTKKQLIDQTS